MIANNGIEVLQQLKQVRYDLIFMDIQMPELDGVATTKRIRETMSAERQPYIVAMTAHALAGDREYFLSTGIDDYISKPVRFDLLQQLLEKLPLLPNEIATDKIEDTFVDEEQTEIGSKLSMEEIVDQAAYIELKQSLGGMMGDLIETYLDDAREHMNHIEQQMKVADWDAMKREMHTFKGASQTMGAKELVRVSLLIENSLSREFNDIELDALWLELKKGFVATCSFFEEQLKIV